jgi:hypothetical protein
LSNALSDALLSKALCNALRDTMLRNASSHAFCFLLCLVRQRFDTTL